MDDAGAEGMTPTLPPADEVTEADAATEREETLDAGAEPEETPDAGAEPEEPRDTGAEPEETPGAGAGAVSLAIAEVTGTAVVGSEVERGAETDEDWDSEETDFEAWLLSSGKLIGTPTLLQTFLRVFLMARQDEGD